MNLSHKQQQALKKVEEWFYKKDKPVFRLFGYAGTGKTTLAKYFADSLGVKVRFAAFTGKAAQVMQTKGAKGASTIHSLIYHPVGMDEVEADGKKSVEPTFVLNKESPLRYAGLLIIDECSMVDENLGRDLLSFGVPILVLGDKGQLPPISGGGFFTNHEPDVHLDEIFRQAEDNPILYVSKLAREGRDLPYGDYGDVKVIRPKDVNADLVLGADQLLVGTHKKRRAYNNRIRELLGFQDIFPCAMDKLVAQRNNLRKGIFNGGCWKVHSAHHSLSKPFVSLLVKQEDDIDNNIVKIKLLKKSFEDPTEEIPWQLRSKYDDFDYGYALTVHKAQGSQWDNVVLFDESFCFREDQSKWLYTAITRAAKQLTIVR